MNTRYVFIRGDVRVEMSEQEAHDLFAKRGGLRAIFGDYDSAAEAEPLRNERPDSGSTPERSTDPPPTASDSAVPLRPGSGEGAGH